MPTFQITAPNGKRYRVSGESPEGAMQALRKMTGAQDYQQPAPPEGMVFDPKTGRMIDTAAREEVMRRQGGDSRVVGALKRTGRVADDAFRGAADIVTFGTADEISAGLGSATGIGGEAGDYEGNLEAQRQRDAEGGAARFAGQMAGAFALPGAAARTVGGAALQSAGMGAAYGFGSGEGGGVERLKNAGYGAAVGGAVGGTVRGITNAFANRAVRRAIPSNDELRKAATTAYNKADAAGVIVKPSGMRRLSQEITADLAEFGYDPALQPGVATVINRINALSDQNVTLKGLDIVRRVAANAAKLRDNPSQQAIASRVIDKLDEFIETLPDQDVLAGNAKNGAQALREARDLWSRLRRSEMVDTAAAKAELRAASTGSGGNVDNVTRQNVRRLLENPRGMTKAERAAAERVVRGTKGQSALRLAGKLSPQGNGLMAALGVGGAMVNPAYGIPSLIGLAAKAVADRKTIANVRRLSELIRSGGLDAAEMALQAAQGIGDEKTVRIVQGLLRREQSLRAAGAPLAAAEMDRVRN